MNGGSARKMNKTQISKEIEKKGQTLAEMHDKICWLPFYSTFVEAYLVTLKCTQRPSLIQRNRSDKSHRVLLALIKALMTYYLNARLLLRSKKVKVCSLVWAYWDLSIKIKGLVLASMVKYSTGTRFSQNNSLDAICGESLFRVTKRF